MIKENNQIFKIAVIDNETEIYSILDEQKEIVKNYNWTHFKSIKKLFENNKEETFNLYLINETIINENTFNKNNLSQLVPALFLLSSNSRYKDLILNNSLLSKILTKPFRLNNLYKTIEEIFLSKNKKKFINIGKYVLSPSEKTFSEFNKSIFLTDIEVKILLKLVQHDKKYVSKNEVLRQVWGIENSYKTHTLETHIYRLRKKILSKFGDEISILSKTGKYLFKYN